MYDFTYKKAGSIDDAVAAHGAADEARYMSGGMTLLPTLKLRLDKPSDVIDLAAIDGLAGITVDGGTVTIGAAASVMNAVVDALAPLGITHIEMPATPENVWRAVQQAKARAA